MSTASELRHVSKLADGLLVGLHFAKQAGDRYTKSPTGMHAQRFVRQLIALETERGRCLMLLEAGADMHFAAEHHGPVVVSGTSYASAHAAITDATGALLGLVSTAAAATEPGDHPEHWLCEGERFLIENVGRVAAAFCRNVATEEVLEHLAAAAKQELARALQKLPTIGYARPTPQPLREDRVEQRADPTSLTADEANEWAMNLAAEKASFINGTAQKWADGIMVASGKPCSPSLVRKTLLWLKTMEGTGRGRKRSGKPRRLRGVRNSDEFLKTLAAQKRDRDPSPLTKDSADSPVRVRSAGGV